MNDEEYGILCTDNSFHNGKAVRKCVSLVSVFLTLVSILMPWWNLNQSITY